ncbi:MAG: V-type ATP synthase subunit F [Myxococcota bacterium]
MARMIVVTTPRLAPGFRLAGVAVREASDADEASEVVRDLVGLEDTAVIGVHEPFLEAMDASRRRRLSELLRPVVIGLPSGEPVDTVAERRRRLEGMLQRAVGFRLSFRPESPEEP